MSGQSSLYEALLEVAELAAIAAPRRKKFAELAEHMARDSEHAHQRGPRWPATRGEVQAKLEALRAAAEHLRLEIASLRDLGATDRPEIADRARNLLMLSDRTAQERFERLVGEIDHLQIAIIGAQKLARKHVKAAGPRWAAPALSQFLKSLVVLVASHGGRLLHSANGGQLNEHCNMAKALNRLRPHLVEGLLPQVDSPLLLRLLNAARREANQQGANVQVIQPAKGAN